MTSRGLVSQQQMPQAPQPQSSLPQHDLSRLPKRPRIDNIRPDLTQPLTIDTREPEVKRVVIFVHVLSQIPNVTNNSHIFIVKFSMYITKSCLVDIIKILVYMCCIFCSVSHIEKSLCTFAHLLINFDIYSKAF